MIFVYILLALILSLLIIAALMPKAYQVEKSVIIAKQPHFVMDKVGDLNNYSRWNPGSKATPPPKALLRALRTAPAINMPGRERR
ncbi:MAG: hypothetical protein IPM85_11030 [Chitinophagaceae bacterium]|nr:hypothetical protein [Chitinophagaceae bacterium]